MLLAGIDLGRNDNVVVVLTDRARRIARFGFTHTRAGYDFLYHRLETLRTQQASPGVLVGMEPTNYFWKWLAADLEARRPDFPYRLVNPYTVRKHREGNQLARAKDDQRDAFEIAELLRTGKFTETRLLQGGYAQLRQYATCYYQLRQDVSRAENRLRSTVDLLFPELSAAFRDWTGATAGALLRRHAAAAHIRQLAWADFVAQVRADFTGQRLQVRKLQHAYELAQHSVGLVEGWPAYQWTASQQLDTCLHLQQQQAAVQLQLGDALLALPEAPYLLSFPGIRVVNAALLLGELGDRRHYTRAKQWVKLAGIQPVPNTSGHRSRSQTPMSHKGRPRLRTTLYWIVLTAVQHDPYFKAHYERLQTREEHPLTKAEALGALMNKALHVIWALLRDQQFYNPQQHPLPPS
jgi:transposase